MNSNPVEPTLVPAISSGSVSYTTSAADRPKLSFSGASDCGAKMDEKSFSVFDDIPPILTTDVAREFATIMKNITSTSEEWERRVNALRMIRGLLNGGVLPEQREAWMLHMKPLADPFCATLRDLRSAVMREACMTLSHMAMTMKAEMFAGSTIPEQAVVSLLKLLYTGVRVMSDSAYMGLKQLVTHVQDPKVLTLIVECGATSKSAVARHRAVEYLGIVLAVWEQSRFEKQQPAIESCILKAIRDADPNARSAARRAFVAYETRFASAAAAAMKGMDGAQIKLLNEERAKANGTAPASTPSTERRASAAVHRAPSITKSASSSSSSSSSSSGAATATSTASTATAASAQTASTSTFATPVSSKIRASSITPAASSQSNGGFASSSSSLKATRVVKAVPTGTSTPAPAPVTTTPSISSSSSSSSSTTAARRTSAKPSSIPTGIPAAARPPSVSEYTTSAAPPLVVGFAQPAARVIVQAPVPAPVPAPAPIAAAAAAAAAAAIAAVAAAPLVAQSTPTANIIPSAPLASAPAVVVVAPLPEAPLPEAPQPPPNENSEPNKPAVSFPTLTIKPVLTAPVFDQPQVPATPLTMMAFELPALVPREPSARDTLQASASEFDWTAPESAEVALSQITACMEVLRGEQSNNETVAIAALKIMTENTVFFGLGLELFFIRDAALLCFKLIDSVNYRERSNVAEECVQQLLLLVPASEQQSLLDDLVKEQQPPLSTSAVLLMLKLQAQYVTGLSVEQVAQLAPQLISRLVWGYKHSAAEVRKTVVFQIVELHAQLGQEGLAPLFAQLNSMQLRLLQVYLDRAKNAAPASALSDSVSCPPAPSVTV